MLCHVRLFETPWTVAHQAPLSLEFLRQEYWIWVAISYARGSSECRLFHLKGRDSDPTLLPGTPYVHTGADLGRTASLRQL